LNFENRDWLYSYRVLDALSDPKKISKVKGGILKQYSSLTKKWEYENEIDQYIKLADTTPNNKWKTSLQKVK